MIQFHQKEKMHLNQTKKTFSSFWRGWNSTTSSATKTPNLNNQEWPSKPTKTTQTNNLLHSIWGNQMFYLRSNSNQSSTILQIFQPGFMCLNVSSILSSHLGRPNIRRTFGLDCQSGRTHTHTQNIPLNILAILFVSQKRSRIHIVVCSKLSLQDTIFLGIEVINFRCFNQ